MKWLIKVMTKLKDKCYLSLILMKWIVFFNYFCEPLQHSTSYCNDLSLITISKTSHTHLLKFQRETFVLPMSTKKATAMQGLMERQRLLVVFHFSY